MIYGFNAMDTSNEHEVGAPTTDIRVRVLGISAAGCLVETTRPLDIGSVATLRLAFSGGDVEDTVQIVKCAEIGGGAVHHVTLAFRATTRSSIESLRYLIRRESGRSIGWIRVTDED